ncbi:MAG: FUN14 domain-containing protein [Candidatus Riflebacteria bacterium]|nr:FUN14 domain-containing protein [Candidatus Riflebacteria bacterium]
MLHFSRRFLFFVFIFAALFMCCCHAELYAAETTAEKSPLDGIPPETKLLLTNLGFGGIAGWCVGFTLKKFAKMAALIVGIGFMAVQFLAYNQYLEINWQKVQSNVPQDSLEKAYVSGMSLLTYNFPFAGAFAGGFWLGFKSG